VDTLPTSPAAGPVLCPDNNSQTGHGPSRPAPRYCRPAACPASLLHPFGGNDMDIFLLSCYLIASHCSGKSLPQAAVHTPTRFFVKLLHTHAIPADRNECLRYPNSCRRQRGAGGWGIGAVFTDVRSARQFKAKVRI